MDRKTYLLMILEVIRDASAVLLKATDCLYRMFSEAVIYEAEKEGDDEQNS